MEIGPILEIIKSVFNQTFIRITTALLIFLFGFIVGKLLGRVVQKVLSEAELNSFIKKSTGISVKADILVSNTIMYAIYFLSLLAALEQLGIGNIILYLLAVAILIIFLVSFFLAIRDFLPNLLSGFYLNGKIKEGQKIECDGIKGEIIHIELLHIKVRTKKGDEIYVPNSLATKSRIKISS